MAERSPKGIDLEKLADFSQAEGPLSEIGKIQKKLREMKCRLHPETLATAFNRLGGMCDVCVKEYVNGTDD